MSHHVCLNAYRYIFSSSFSGFAINLFPDVIHPHADQVVLDYFMQIVHECFQCLESEMAILIGINMYRLFNWLVTVIKHSTWQCCLIESP